MASRIYAGNQAISSYEIARNLLLLEMEIERTSFLYSKLHPIYQTNLYDVILKDLSPNTDNMNMAEIGSLINRHKSILMNRIEKYLGNKKSSHKQILYFTYMEYRTGRFPAMTHFNLKTANWSKDWENVWKKFMNTSFNHSLTTMYSLNDEILLKNFILRFRKSYQKELLMIQKNPVYWQILFKLSQTVENDLISASSTSTTKD